MSVERNLTINEKTSYPLGNVELYRIPDTLGIYLKDNGNYLPLRKAFLKPIRTAKKEHSMALGYYNQYSYLTPKDSVFEIKLSELKELCFVDYSGMAVELTEDNNGKLAISTISPLSKKVSAKYVKHNNTKISSGLYELKFIPEYDKVYSLMNIQINSFSEEMSGNSFCFKVVK